MFNVVDKNYKFDNGNTYKIVYSIELDDQMIYYLININDFSDFKFCHSYEEIIFEEIKDTEVLKKVIDVMSKGAAVFLK